MMEHCRSKSWKDPRMQRGSAFNNQYGIDDFNGESFNYHPTSNPSGMQDLRCYSASYAASSLPNSGKIDIVVAAGGGDQWKFKKGKSTNGVSSKNWNFNDPELQRKKRVASYKAYTVEGKVKGSIKKSFRWFKERCNLMLYGYR